MTYGNINWTQKFYATEKETYNYNFKRHKNLRQMHISPHSPILFIMFGRRNRAVLRKWLALNDLEQKTGILIAVNMGKIAMSFVHNDLT